MSIEAMQHQDRVKTTLQGTIRSFFSDRLSFGTKFTGEEFLNYVFSRHTCAANSPLRILQVLKKAGVINYSVVKADYLNRQKTVYEALPAVVTIV